MAPRVAMCTAAEANQIKADLQGSVAVVDAKIQPAVDAASAQLRTEVKEVADLVAKNATTSQQAVDRVAKDSKSYSDAQTDKVRREFDPRFPPIDRKIQEAQQGLEVRIQAVDQEVRVALADEIQALGAQFDQQLSALKAELSEQSEKWAREAAEEIVKQRKEVDLAIEQLRKEAEERVEARAQAGSQECQAIMPQVHKLLEEAKDRSVRAEGEVNLKIDRLNDELQELQVASQERSDRVEQAAQSEVGKLREDAETRLASLDQEATKLKDAISEVENLSTRRVDWVIQKVSQRLRPSTPRSKASLHTSWFSPKFDMAGAHGLQLELQLFRPSDPPVEDEAAGDCAVFLWACKGMSLVYKLYLGKKVASLEKVFNGRVPYGTKRLCFLKDQINREDDTLRVSVEILEAVRDIEHPVKPPPLPTDPDEAELAVQPLEGLVVARRHVNNRVVDQVKKEVELMRSRMVRRIEWRLEHASLLRRCFPPGESMCSVAFNAAGIEGMQLIFYPSGYGNCTDGMCSLFLHGPAGVTLKCSLSAGSQRRDASHYFEEPGAFGRTNFCRFESAVDPEEDTILLALDVEEAHQDVQANVAHPLVKPGDRRSQAQIDGDLPSKVESVVKLKRVPGKTMQGMEERRVLPSMWQAKSLSSDPLPEGFHSFEELRGRGGRQRGEASPVVGSLSATRRSESMPSLKEAGEKTRLDGDLVPLPQLNKTGGSDWGFDLTSSRGPKKGRLPGRRDRMHLTSVAS
mmetsp:Transcript_88847/g.287719  ORF Transcript_88847/g.287719 Transcript_88847/m.287719 type:complete len:746 (+) Transcript_88847:99-2336(+)